MILFLKMSYR